MAVAEEPVQVDYQLGLDRNWATRTVAVSVRTGDGAFVAELEVDDLGLVVTYEGGWPRLAAANGGGSPGKEGDHARARRL